MSNRPFTSNSRKARFLVVAAIVTFGAGALASCSPPGNPPMGPSEALDHKQVCEATAEAFSRVIDVVNEVQLETLPPEEINKAGIEISATFSDLASRTDPNLSRKLLELSEKSKSGEVDTSKFQMSLSRFWKECNDAGYPIELNLTSGG